VSYKDRESTWNSGVQKAIRQGSAEEEVRKHRDRVTGAWKQISKQRRRVDVSCEPSMVTALQHGTCMVHGWMRRVSKILLSRRRKKGEAPTSLSGYGTWVTDFMLRQDAGRFMLGKYLSDKKSHGSEGDNWGWRWQEIRQQPVF